MVERESVPGGLTKEIARGVIVEIKEGEVLVQMNPGESVMEDGRDYYSIVALGMVGVVPKIGETLVITDVLLNAEFDVVIAGIESWEESDEEISPSTNIGK